jgi:YVTN family beta-propeller protein
MKNIFLFLFVSVYTSGVFCQNYEVSNKISSAGDGGWDYLTVDNLNQNLFVSHGNVVNIVDLKTDKVVATIPDTKGVHGIAIASDLNKAFISNGKDNSISIVDLKTFELIEKVKIEGLNPDAILYDKFSHKVFAYNARSEDATVLDARTNKVVETIPLGGKPEFSVSNTKGLIYVNIEDKNEIKVIDAISLSVIDTWSIAPGEEPSGLAIDLKTNRLFSVCANKVMIVVNALDGKIITSLAIGDGCDGVVFDAKNKLVFSANGEGTMTVVKELNANAFSVIGIVKTQNGARTIAINPKTSLLYLPTADYGLKPKSTSDNPNPRFPIVPNTFKVLVVEKSR